MLTMLRLWGLLFLITFLFGFSLNIEKKGATDEKSHLQKIMREKIKFPSTTKETQSSKSNKDRGKYFSVGEKKSPRFMSIAETEALETAIEKMGYAGRLMMEHIIGTTTLDYATAYFGRHIAMGPDTVLHAVWCSHEEPDNVVFYSRSVDHGRNWSQQLPINDGYYGYKPAIAVDPNNGDNVFVAYSGYQNMGEVRSMRVVKSTDGGFTWGYSMPIYGSAMNGNNPDIVVDGNGNPHVTFDSYDDRKIRYNFSSDSGATWLEEPELVSLELVTEGAFGPTIAIDRMGNPHVAFGEGSASGWNVLGCCSNWRDMSTGTWMHVPPLQHPNNNSGTCATSMVFAPDAVSGHFFYDGGGGTQGRSVWYRSMTYNSETNSWDFGTPEEFVLSAEHGGSTFWPSAGIDQDGILFLMYADNLAVGDIGGDAGNWDLFTGTNLSGKWNFNDLTADGCGVLQKYPNATSTVIDSTFHIIYTQPPNVVHETGYPWWQYPDVTVALNNLCDTYSLTGPFSFTARTKTNEGFIIACSLYVEQNDILVFADAMIENSLNNYSAEVFINGAPGNKISYSAKAYNNYGSYGFSFGYPFNEFEICEPSQPGADILLVGDDLRLFDHYDRVLSDLGYMYEFWDVNEHHGIDESVTNWGWNIIIVAGFGIGSVPTRDYEENPYAAFLDDGGNMALMSQDWFFGQGEPAGNITFEPGDFAYDYFQIGGGTNDPGEDIDSVLYGYENDPISHDWEGMPLNMSPALSGLRNWIDWTYATGTGVNCFYASNSGQTVGVWNETGSYRTLFLPFMFEWLLTEDVLPNQDAYTLMENILTFFQAQSPPIFYETSGPRYGVYGYGPYPVSAKVEDLKLQKELKALVSVEVGYKSEYEQQYTYVSLNEKNNGLYEGSIPELPNVPDISYTYIFKATDDADHYTFSKPFQFHTTGLEHTLGAKLLYCGDEKYVGNYYTESVDQKVTAILALLLNTTYYDYWDVDQYGSPDYQSVLSHYNSVIWHGYADWDATVFPKYTIDNPFYPYVQKGGNLLFSSEEMFGVLYANVDGSYPSEVTTEPGESVYDILGVSWIAPDFNYDTIRVMDQAEILAGGMDSLLILDALPLEPYGLGHMGDLVDPVFYGEPWIVYLFDAWLPENQSWYGDWGYGLGWYTGLTTGGDPSYGSKKIILPFCIASLDSVNRYQFLQNVIYYFSLGDELTEGKLPPVPIEFALYPNYPNPFNPTTTIGYDLPEQSQVELAVYNILGRKIKTVVNSKKDSGRYQTTWDGRDDFGNSVASGVYVYQIKAGDFKQSFKMLLVK